MITELKSAPVSAIDELSPAKNKSSHIKKIALFMLFLFANPVLGFASTYCNWTFSGCNYHYGNYTIGGLNVHYMTISCGGGDYFYQDGWTGGSGAMELYTDAAYYNGGSCSR